MTFDINGEFGYELFAALPLVNWYKEQGHNIVVRGAKGSSLLYPNIKVNEVYESREPFLKVNIDNQPYYKQHNHVAGIFSNSDVITSTFDANISSFMLSSQLPSMYSFTLYSAGLSPLGQ